MIRAPRVTRKGAGWTVRGGHGTAHVQRDGERWVVDIEGERVATAPDKYAALAAAGAALHGARLGRRRAALSNPRAAARAKALDAAGMSLRKIAISLEREWFTPRRLSPDGVRRLLGRL